MQRLGEFISRIGDPSRLLISDWKETHQHLPLVSICAFRPIVAFISSPDKMVTDQHHIDYALRACRLTPDSVPGNMALGILSSTTTAGSEVFLNHMLENQPSTYSQLNIPMPPVLYRSPSRYDTKVQANKEAANNDSDKKP